MENVGGDFGSQKKFRRIQMMKKQAAFLIALVMLAGCIFSLFGCSEKAEQGEIPLKLVSTDENLYAEHFKIERYEQGVNALTLYNGDMEISGKFLLVENDSTFTGEVEGWTKLETPLTNTLVASGPAMSLVAAVGGLSGVKLAETTTWYIDSVNEAIENGEIIQVGKLAPSASDPWQSEVVVMNRPELAICSAMLPINSKYEERKKEFEDNGIPYFLDESTNENHVMGRTEWLKVMGLLFGQEEKAAELFDGQVEKYRSILNKLEEAQIDEKKSVAITYVTSKSVGYFRNPDDYIVGMLNAAGGVNVCPDGDKGENSTSVSGEVYYSTLKEDVDIMLYNISLGGSKDSAIQGRIDSLIEWEEFKTFDVYKNNQIWVTERKLYQSMDCLADMMEDMYRIMYEADVPDQLTFMHRLDLSQFD